MKIREIQAREILDSRGNPTVAAFVELTDGSIGEAAVPSGASTGSGEAYELRDGQKERFSGQGVLKAVRNVNEVLAQTLLGWDAADQKGLDAKMMEIDATPNKKNMGANAILAVSLAAAKAEAVSQGLELYEYLAAMHGTSAKNLALPTPMFNILNGGQHASNNLDIQETMIVPIGLDSFEKKLRAGAEIYHVLRNELINKGFSVGLGDEGGFAPEFTNNEAAIEAVAEAIKQAGYESKDVRISLDVASTEFEENGQYKLKADDANLSSDDFSKKVTLWAQKYQLLSVEDGLAEADQHWPELTAALGETISVGDDLFTTNPEKIAAGAKAKIATGVIIKPNQIGTLTETLAAIKAAQEGGIKVIVSHRSGETEDTFIADLAVGTGAEFIKSGAPARSERLAKYNRLAKIEDLINEFNNS